MRVSNYVIAISRGFGSGGKSIGLMLSQKLGIPCYESQILALASESSGISKAKFAQVDEKLRRATLLTRLKAAPNIDHILLPTDKKFVSDDNLFNIQTKIIRQLAERESCIIIGKCANYVLRDMPNVVSAYIEAPRAYCLKSIMDRMGVTEDEAHKLITNVDKYRANYFRYYTNGRQWTDPVLYDMTINTERVGKENAVEIIKDCVNIKFAGDLQ